MSRIPVKEADLLFLAEEMMSGLKSGTGIFPAPPVTAEELEIQINHFMQNHDNVTAAKAAYEAAVASKNTAYETVDKSVRDNAYYCKKVADGNDALLTKVGLSARKKGPNEKPGQCGNFRVVKQGEGSASFVWKRPKDGGSPRIYKIERKEAGSNIWVLIAAAMELKADLQEQTIGSAFEYRVVASNKIGDGIPSNIVSLKF